MTKKKKSVKKNQLRRGFKKEANEFARELRAELEIPFHAPLCPWNLAKHLDIPIEPLSAFNHEIPREVAFFMNQEPASFSATTVFKGLRRLIIHNDAHHFHRQASNIAHELSHAILAHPPTPPLNDYGLRNYNNEYEAEANWLGPTLLISEEAALYIAKSMTLEQAMESYKVSKEVIRMRLNVTGASKRIARSQNTRKTS